MPNRPIPANRLNIALLRVVADVDPDTEDWAARALCRTRGRPEWWDLELDRDRPGERAPDRLARWIKAAQVCAACPVIAQCRASFDPERDAGVWAGEVRNGHADPAPVLGVPVAVEGDDVLGVPA